MDLLRIELRFVECHSTVLPLNYKPETRPLFTLNQAVKRVCFFWIISEKTIQKQIGAQGGSRTRRTYVLSVVPMPIRLQGQKLEHPARIERANTSFAEKPLNHLGMDAKSGRDGQIWTGEYLLPKQAHVAICGTPRWNWSGRVELNHRSKLPTLACYRYITTRKRQVRRFRRQIEPNDLKWHRMTVTLRRLIRDKDMIYY